MSEDIKIKMIIDDEEFNATLRKSEKEIEASGKKQANSFKPLEDQLKKLNETFEEQNKIQLRTLEFQEKNQISLRSQLTATIGSIIKLGTITGAVMLLTKEKVLEANDAVYNLFKTFSLNNNLDRFFGIEKATEISNVIATIASEFHWTIKLLVAGRVASAQLFDELKRTTSGIFGLERTFREASYALEAFSLATGGLGSGLADVLSKLSLFGSALAILISYIISEAILGIANLAQTIGSKLTKVADEATKKFIEFDQQTSILTSTVKAFNETFGDVGNIKDYVSLIDELSLKLNISNTTLQKSASEIVSVGSKIGLNKDQILSLITATSEFAKIYHKDAFDAAVSFGQALQGSSQSVQAYGVKLTEASNQHFLLSKGIEESFNQLNEYDKVQVRFNNLMEQYAIVAGIGEIAANSLADAQKRNEILTENLSRKFGEGASLIEGWNIQGYLLNKLLDTINPTIIKTTGFFTALFGRILSGIGLIVELSFKFYLLKTVISILNVLLKSDAWDMLASKKIPNVGRSIDQLVKSISTAQTKIRSLSDLLKVLQEISTSFYIKITNQTKNFFETYKTFGAILDLVKFKLYQWAIATEIVFQRVLIVIQPFIARMSLLLIPFIKFVAIGGLVYYAIKTLISAFKLIEEKTTVLTTLWEIMVDTFMEVGSIFKPITDFFKNMWQRIIDSFYSAFGLLVYIISSSINLIVTILKQNWFGFFSEKSVASLDKVQKKLNSFNGNVKDLGFNISKLGEDGSKSFASLGSSFEKVNLDDIQKLEDDLKNAGKTQLQIIEDTKNQQLMIIADGFRQGLISQKRYTEDAISILKKFNQDQENEINKLREPFTQMTKNIKDAGKNNIDILRTERNERLKILQDISNNGLLKENEFGSAKLLIIKKYQQDFKKLREEEKKPIIDLSNELKYAGQIELEELKNKTQEKFKILTNGLSNELINQKEFSDLSLLLQKDYQAKIIELENKKIKPYLDVQKTIRDASYTETQQLKLEFNERKSIIEQAAIDRLITQEQLHKSLLDNEKYYNKELTKIAINQESTWSQLGDAIKNEFSDIGISMADIAKDIKKGLIDGIGQSFQWLGRSLATHKADWQDLQNNIGNILAGMASMLGNFFIAVGLGMTATGPILGLSGGAAIAAGIGLQILAGALGSMGGEKVNAQERFSGSATGLESTGPDLNNTINKPDQQQRTEPSHVLNVNIMGDVLDSDETSMRIVKLINEAYDKKGVVLRQGAYA